ncbi:hypothetical protein [Flavicella sp.]|uniref:hypothetical protein n=1 Tax=Flavicella sp. TaxID=2957742 RepID=UPI00262082E7|nr:hypothetical protein [Flavicella sp.]MDG1803919.1 hypothetical protein [Flavicella sp.]
MKKIISVMFALVLGTVATIAANPETMTINEKLRSEIERLLDHPDFLENEKIISAKVEFLVNQRGEIVVLLVDSKDERIINFIKTRLNYQSVVKASEELKNKKFSVPIKVIKK